MWNPALVDSILHDSLLCEVEEHSVSIRQWKGQQERFHLDLLGRVHRWRPLGKVLSMFKQSLQLQWDLTWIGREGLPVTEPQGNGQPAALITWTSHHSSLPPFLHSIFQMLTEGMYFKRDPCWCDGHEGPVWNGNLDILHSQREPGISQKREWREMEQVKNSHLYWGFPFKNTRKYEDDISYSGYDAITSIEYSLTNKDADYLFFSYQSWKLYTLTRHADSDKQKGEKKNMITEINVVHKKEINWATHKLILQCESQACFQRLSPPFSL